MPPVLILVLQFAILQAFTLAQNNGESCPAFSDFRPWTEECLWFPVEEIRAKSMNACGISLDPMLMPSMPMPPGLTEALPDRCGYCSFKVRCQLRRPAPGCFPINMERKTCEEYTNACELPKNPIMNDCDWNLIMETLKQCVIRPDLPEWKRAAFKKLAAVLPESTCVEKDGKCRCCCHPFTLSADSTSCVRQELPSCVPWSPWNDWSDCLWYPLTDLVDNFHNHCGAVVRSKSGSSRSAYPQLPLPAGFEVPEKCGYCSFKIRCRKRPPSDSHGEKKCFPLEIDKKVCGSADCPTCTEICTLPQVNASCNYGSHLRKFLQKPTRILAKMPYWRRHGIISILKYLPAPECISKDGVCKCCCNPYIPNEEATACVLKDFCKAPAIF